MMKAITSTVVAMAVLAVFGVCSGNPTSFGVFAIDGKTPLVRASWNRRCLDDYGMTCRMKHLNCCQGGLDLNSPASAPRLASPELLAYFSDPSIPDALQLWGPLTPKQFCLNTGDNGRVCTPKFLNSDDQYPLSVEPKGTFLFRFYWTAKLIPGSYMLLNSKNGQAFVFKIGQ